MRPQGLMLHLAPRKGGYGGTVPEVLTVRPDGASIYRSVRRSGADMHAQEELFSVCQGEG